MNLLFEIIGITGNVLGIVVFAVLATAIACKIEKIKVDKEIEEINKKRGD